MANLNPMKVGKVVGQFLANVADGPDIGLGPDYPPLEGHVYFTARAKRVAVRDGTPNPATFYGIRHDVVLDENGYLTHNGARGIMLAVPSADAQPQEWTWWVEFSLTYLDQKITGATSFDIDVPEFIPGPDPENEDEGSVGLVDLTLVAPVTPAGGQPTIVGPPGRGIVSISVDGTALVFDMTTGLDETVEVPALASAAADAATASAAAGSATSSASSASSSASVATTKAAEAAASAAEAAGYVGGVADGAITTPKIVDDAVTSPKVSAAIRVSLGKADTAVQPTRTVSAGTGLSGGGDLSADRSFAVAYGTAAGTAAEGNDSRITGAVPNTRTVSAGTGLTGGGALTANRSLAADFGTGAGKVTQGNDARLTDTRTPTVGTSPFDVSFVAQTGTRATGLGDVAAGIKFRRAVTFSSAHFHCETADASGNLSAEVCKNGSATGMPAVTIAAASQVAGAAASGTYSFAAGDVMTVNVTAVGTTPGKGLVVDLLGLA
ncbi:hypothetical protein ACHIPZ_25015 [Antrihabitans sp. NCIMB 15449]|uniref:Tail fiber protein n=1 Tax=Antrihabitans spumae TaxID=3373370 RepID=A0ABW7JTU5_9NOCA